LPLHRTECQRRRISTFRARDEPLRRLATGIGHAKLCLIPNTLAGVEACGQVLEELDRIGRSPGA
jgi:hypothetical protein